MLFNKLILSIVISSLSLLVFLNLGCQVVKNSEADSSALLEADPIVPEEIEVYFHPYETTFKPIAELINDTQYTRIDIAMYSMEVNNSLIIEALEAQRPRIDAGELQVRVIFQGYGNPCKKCLPLESLGVDVRQIDSKDVHHKFGIFYNQENGSVMTGSGNWSNSSNQFYDENMFRIRNHPGLASAYITEFQKLWAFHEPQRQLTAQEQELNRDDDPNNDVWDSWGKDLNIESWPTDPSRAVEEGIIASFNSNNFKFSDTSAQTIVPKKFVLTNNLVKLIDTATTTLDIATPRISLRPVFDALVRAAGRGVKIRIMSTEAEYEHPNSRDASLRGQLFSCDLNQVLDSEGNVKAGALKKHFGRCCSQTRNTVEEDLYAEKCSTSQNHLKFLVEGEFPGAENIAIRLKLFTWFPNGQSISKQMHAKFTIADNRFLMAGSFNYSYNSEYGLFENVITVDGTRYPNTLTSTKEKFERMYERNRDEFAVFQQALEEAHRDKTKIDCPEIMFSLTYDEIEHFLATRQRHNQYRSLKMACNE